MNRRKKILIYTLVFSTFISCTPPLNRSGWMFASQKNRGIVHTAKRYIGVPYRYGGASPRGFDCSGYTMYVYNRNGIQLPRSAKKQYHNGKKVSLRRAQPGDLVFFRTSRQTYSHVGIYLGNYRFIHAPSTGKGVSTANMKISYWRKRFKGAVTYGNRRKSVKRI